MLVSALLFAGLGPPPAAAEEPPEPDLFDLSLDQLMGVTIISVAKREQRLGSAAAAVYVITSEDIRRAGVRSLPEALRMVPGIQVAQVDRSRWAVSSRGFNARFQDKLLVLVDGRTVYTPLFAGVFWELQDLLLADIEQIEVIRGPGATLWGANAVNGIINFITKSAWDTFGGHVELGAGNEGTSVAMRYGGRRGDDLAYRVYAKTFDRDSLVDAGGSDARDDWQDARGGFRLDWRKSASEEITLQGDLFDSEAGIRQRLARFAPPFLELVDQPVDYSGGNLLGRWRRQRSETSQLTLQLYYDRVRFRSSAFSELRETADFELQQDLTVGRRHRIVWGLGHRVSEDETDGSPTTFLTEPSRTLHLTNVFLQDQITLVEDRLFLTVGSKFEHNEFTGLEIQPGIRLRWSPADGTTLWGSVARAVRTPSRVEDSILSAIAVQPSQIPGVVIATSQFGNPSLESEELIAFEIGLRRETEKKLTIDLAAFYNDYPRLRGFVGPGEPDFQLGPPPRIVVPVTFEDVRKGNAYGLEVATSWQATDRWRLAGSYSYLRLRLRADTSNVSLRGAAALGPRLEEGQSPRHQLHLRSFLDLPDHFKLDLAAYFVDRLPEFDVPSYLRLDVRLARSFGGLELSLIGQNLLDERHAEFGVATPTEITSVVEREVLALLTWRF